MPREEEISFQVANANCGNDVLGENACRKLIEAACDSGLVIINCEEIRLKPAIQQLLTHMSQHEHLRLYHSDLRVTRTKAREWLPFSDATGMSTIVLYDVQRYLCVDFEKDKLSVAVGKNANKGATINTLKITVGEIAYRIKTISGHLESYKPSQRVDEWLKIRQLIHPDIGSWDELEAIIPDAIAAGYDANIRSVVDAQSGQTTNLWHQLDKLDGRIAALVLAPLGGDLIHSAADTYKCAIDPHTGQATAKVHKPDPKRKGYINAGSLDFVATQNNTVAQSSVSTTDYRYSDPSHNILPEPGTKRDHNVIISPSITLAPQIEPFIRVRTHISKQLREAFSAIAEMLSGLSDTPSNRDVLLQVYQRFLAPYGLLDALILNTPIDGIYVDSAHSTETLTDSCELSELGFEYQSGSVSIAEISVAEGSAARATAQREQACMRDTIAELRTTKEATEDPATGSKCIFTQ